MRCKTCHYLLANLTEHRCPECGREFDPNDASTFHEDGYVPLSRTGFLFIGSGVYAAFVLFVLFYVRSSEVFLLLAGALVLICMFGMLHLLHWANWKTRRLKL